MVVRNDQRKVSKVDRKATTPLALFDMTSNPGETNNLADQRPDIVARLTQMADEIRKDIGDGAASTPASGDAVAWAGANCSKCLPSSGNTPGSSSKRSFAPHDYITSRQGSFCGMPSEPHRPRDGKSYRGYPHYPTRTAWRSLRSNGPGHGASA